MLRDRNQNIIEEYETKLDELKLQSEGELIRLRGLLQQQKSNAVSSSDLIAVEESNNRMSQKVDELQRALEQQTKEKEELRKKYEKRISDLTIKFDELESFLNKEFNRKLKERDEESELLRVEYADLKREINRKDKKIESLLNIAPRSREASQRRNETELLPQYSLANSTGYYKFEQRGLDSSERHHTGTSDLEKLIPQSVNAGSEKKIQLVRSPSLEKYNSLSTSKKTRVNSAFSYSSLPKYDKIIPERLFADVKTPEQFSSLLYRGY